MSGKGLRNRRALSILPTQIFAPSLSVLPQVNPLTRRTDGRMDGRTDGQRTDAILLTHLPIHPTHGVIVRVEHGRGLYVDEHLVLFVPPLDRPCRLNVVKVGCHVNLKW